MRLQESLKLVCRLGFANVKRQFIPEFWSSNWESSSAIAFCRVSWDNKQLLWNWTKITCRFVRYECREYSPDRRCWVFCKWWARSWRQHAFWLRASEGLLGPDWYDRVFSDLAPVSRQHSVFSVTWRWVYVAIHTAGGCNSPVSMWQMRALASPQNPCLSTSLFGRWNGWQGRPANKLYLHG